MSEGDFMQDSDPEQYDFEYEDEDEDQGIDVDIENKYYNAKQIKIDQPEIAIDEFLGVPELEAERGNWGFRGLKQAIKLEYKLKRYEDATQHYKEILVYVKSAVTKNYSEKSINNMLDYIEKNSEDEEAHCYMEKFYSMTLATFQNTNNESLWLKTNIKLAKLWLERRDYRHLTEKLRELHIACQKDDGTDDPSRGTYSLEIYALEILMYAETRNNKRLKALYQKALRVRSAVPHPKIMGIIRECGGKMHMSEENWEEAQTDFFESFRNYDEAGSLQRIQVLKYLVLTTMLTDSTINPFDSQETKPYKSDPRIAAMTSLVDSFQRDDIHAYEKVLQSNRDILEDPFIAENIDEVTRNIRTKAVIKMIAPYTRFHLSFIAEQLEINLKEVQDIIGFLVVDNKIHAKIDQKEGIVVIDKSSVLSRTTALDQWSISLNSLSLSILNSLDGLKHEATFGFNSNVGYLSDTKMHSTKLLDSSYGLGKQRVSKEKVVGHR